MKIYVVVTGIVFALLAVAHIARIIMEGAQVLFEPIFLFTSVVSIGIMLWAIILLERARK